MRDVLMHKKPGSWMQYGDVRLVDQKLTGVINDTGRRYRAEL